MYWQYYLSSNTYSYNLSIIKTVSCRAINLRQDTVSLFSVLFIYNQQVIVQILKNALYCLQAEPDAPSPPLYNNSQNV